MLLCVYVIVSLAMIFNTNPYQHSIYLTSANAVTSTVYGFTSQVSSYFNLRDINEDLQRRNSELELELLAANDRLTQYEEQRIATGEKPLLIDSAVNNRYDYIIAHVINKSIHLPHNYITINKGSLDGVKPEMGVIDQNGVVGKVNIVGPHSARVISLLNDYLRLSCKVKNTQQVGSLSWDGKDSRYAVLAELPRHATFNKGDTVVTSGYSSTFPSGVPVGVIYGEMKDYDDNFYTLRIKLFTDFYNLSTVRVVVDNMSEEIGKVEEDAEMTKK